MNASQTHLHRLWNEAVRAWRAFFRGEEAAPKLAFAMRNFLVWKDITTAASLRYRAHKENTIVPSLSVPAERAVTFLLDKNLWAQKHVRDTQPVLHWVVQKAVESEQNFLQAQAVAVEAGLRKESLPAESMLISRQRQFMRDKMMEVVNTSEQVQLADPYIGEKFPMSSYYSREDRRVRPTHREMDGLVALRTWPGWAWCRPLCGYGCRCTLRHWSVSECLTQGWLTKDLRPRFEVKWPNPRAKANYLRGVPYHDNTDPHAFPSSERNRIFPDVGPWMQAKFTAGTGLAEAA